MGGGKSLADMSAKNSSFFMTLASARDLERIFFLSSRRRFLPGSQSNHCRRVDGFWLQCSFNIALQVDMIQVVASKEHWPGDMLPETLDEIVQWVNQIYKILFKAPQLCPRIHFLSPPNSQNYISKSWSTIIHVFNYRSKILQLINLHENNLWRIRS